MAVKEASVAAATLGAIGGGVAAHQLGLGSSASSDSSGETLAPNEDKSSNESKWELKDLNLECSKDSFTKLQKLFDNSRDAKTSENDIGNDWTQIDPKNVCWYLDVSSGQSSKLAMVSTEDSNGVIVYAHIPETPASSLSRGVIYITKDNKNNWKATRGFEFTVENDWFGSTAKASEVKIKFTKDGNDEELTSKKIYKWKPENDENSDLNPFNKVWEIRWIKTTITFE